jgi:NarL family two-component system response regulator YdfI
MSETPETPKRIRVLIADDHPVVRTGLRLMLQMRQEFELVGEAADGASAVRLVGEVQPDVVLMDLRMPGMDGLEAIEAIRRDWPQVAVIILTTYNEDALMIRGLRAGARGYVLKDTDLETIFQAIRRAAQGELLVQPEVMQRLLSHAERAIAAPRSPSVERPLSLTARERDILAGVARGERSKEIALRLGLSERTIWAYLTTIYNKLGVDSRASAVAVAMERGLLSRQE